MKNKTPPSSAKKQEQAPQKKRKQYIKHSTPDGLRQGLNRLMNKIIACDDPLSHAGQYASLANAMTNSQKLSFDINDFRKLQAEVEELKEKMKKE
jgi:hypothetical protein